MENKLFATPKTKKVVFFCYGTMTKQLSRKKVFNFLLTKSVKIHSNHEYYNSNVKSLYHDAYDFIIKNFNQINHIQIYNDNTIELWYDKRSSSKLIVFEDHNFRHDELTSKLLKELIAFAKNAN